MNDRQRVVLVVALGLAIAVIVHTWDAIISTHDDGGWFAYAPNTNPIFSSNDNGEVVRRGAMWLGGVAAWAAISLVVLRRRTDRGDT